MRTILTTIAMLAFASLASAEAAKIDIINAYKVGGMLQKTGDYIHTSLPDQFNEPTNVGSCAAAATILANTDKPTIAVWNMVEHATTEDTTCNIATSDNFISIYTQSYYSFCGLTDNKDNTLEMLLNGNKKVAVMDSALTKLQLEKALQGIHSNATLVPYPTSADVLAALEIGEVDYVYTGRLSDDMTCVLTHNPESQIAKVSDYFTDPFAYSGFKVVVLGVNVDKEQIKATLDSTHLNADWSEKFTGYNHDMRDTPRIEQFQQLDAEITSIRSAQGK